MYVIFFLWGWKMYTESGYHIEDCCMIHKGHVKLITEKEFRQIQIQEIKRYQEIGKDFSNERAMEWVSLYAAPFREKWTPHIYPHPALIRKAKAEISKHRWIESEKAGRNLKAEAEMDWIKRHSRSFLCYWSSCYATANA